eukprot:jgi/Picre1/28089/NNA_001048.t1
MQGTPALNKVRLPYVMSFTGQEEKTGNYRFIPARYPETGCPIHDAITVLKQYDTKFYDDLLHFRMGLMTLEEGQQGTTRQQKYEWSLSSHATRLFNSRMASYWALTSTQCDNVKVHWAGGAQEDGHTQEEAREDRREEEASPQQQGGTTMSSPRISSMRVLPPPPRSRRTRAMRVTASGSKNSYSKITCKPCTEYTTIGG